MPEEIKTEPKDTTIVTKNETTEVVNAPGQTNEGVKRLSSMFDKIAEGKSEGVSAKDTIASMPKLEPKKEVEKPVEKVKEEKVEVKAEDSDLSKKLNETQQKKDEKKEEEVSREALRKSTEEQKVEDKKEEVKAEDEVPEEELKVMATDKPKTAKRIQALLKKIETVTSEVTKTKAEAKEKADKLAEYEAKLNSVKTVDPETAKKVEEQQSELAMLRRRYELDKDPEVNKKYDSRVDQAEERITKVLTARNAGKALLDLIKEEGGFQKFAGSGRTITVQDEQLTAAELADRVLNALPLGERKIVEAAMMDQVQTKMERERFFKEQQDSAVEYFKKKEEENAKRGSEFEKQVAEGRKAIEEFQNKALQAEWMKDREIPANATPTEKAAAEEYNKYNSQLRSLLKKATTAKELPEMFDIITDSVRYYDERRTSGNLRNEVARLKSELQAKQLEINKFKGAGRTVPKAGSIASGPADSGETKEARPTSISDAFDRLQRGESLRQTVMADE
jgi:hypothetical protein